MILEHALLSVIPGKEDEFTQAFALARPFIESSAGFHGVTLSQGVESPNSFLLLVQWDSVDDHMVGFRESEAFQSWSALLKPFYSAPSVVEHYEFDSVSRALSA